jgi:hypothetical protein
MRPFTGLAGADLAALCAPSEAEYVAAYCRRTERDGIPDLDFYHTPLQAARAPAPGSSAIELFQRLGLSRETEGGRSASEAPGSAASVRLSRRASRSGGDSTNFHSAF